MAASWLARRGRSEWGNISGGLAPGNGYDELVARYSASSEAKTARRLLEQFREKLLEVKTERAHRTADHVHRDRAAALAAHGGRVEAAASAIKAPAAATTTTHEGDVKTRLPLGSGVPPRSQSIIRTDPPS